MGEELHEVSFEHSWGGLKEPVRRVDNFDVTLVIEVPNLLHEGDVWVDEARDVFLEAADSHGVG